MYLMQESRAVQFLVLAVAIVASCVDAFVPRVPWLTDFLPFSTKTCYLGSVSICSIILVLLVESKYRSKSGELQTDESSKAPSMESQKREWRYIDPTGAIHGPFSTMEMLQWYKAGYLSQNLMISFGESNGFHPLHALFPETSDAFTSPPSSVDLRSLSMTESVHLADFDQHEVEVENDDEDVAIREWMERRRAHYCSKANVTECIRA